ncbi:hypothetical protein Bbelb_133370 [Branchiostoma belcheri]|nr:hypothetical protein Bbelb_133370 [Branchiostoma belcheri]
MDEPITSQPGEDTERSQSKQETRPNDILTLLTVHHSDIAALVVAQEDPPEMKVQVYQRPGAPIAGLMMYARLDGTWYPCGWIREKNKDSVPNLSSEGGLESLSCVLQDRYTKKGYHVLKVSIL